MTDEQLRAYAIAGVSARLAELDRERSELQALLTRFTADANSSTAPAPDATAATAAAGTTGPRTRTMSPEGRRRIGDAARQRWAARREAAAAASSAGAPAAEPDAARVLPRRGRSHRPIATPPEDALPPMPRLIKGKTN